MRNETQERIGYAELIKLALTVPAVADNCYKLFHDYSLLNSLYIIRQLQAKNLPVEPVKGYKAWEQLNRAVKPELLTGKTRYGFPKAIEILFPVFGYFTPKNEDGTQKTDKDGKPVVVKYVKDFTYSKWHFSVSQTNLIDATKAETLDGKNRYNVNVEKLCADLEIEIRPYDKIEGNPQGYTTRIERFIALNPVAKNPVKTAIHEIAHCLLHDIKCDYFLNTPIIEAEAEMVAYLVCKTICSDEDLSTCHAYIQNWLGNNEFTDEMGQRVMNTASKILNLIKGKE